MIEPVKFLVWVENENLEIFTELLKKKKILFEIIGDSGNLEFKVIEVRLYPRQNFSKGLIRFFHNSGRSYSYIAKEIGCSKSYVEKVINENSDD